LVVLLWQGGLRPLAWALPPTVFGLTLASQSSASVLALGAGLLAALLSGLGRPLARGVMAVALIVTLLGSPFAAGLARQAGLAQADWLAETAQYRLHIWTVVSERIAERPLLGWGFDASPDLPAGAAQPFRPGDKIIPSHPHNGALQIMVETGLAGSLLVLGLLFLLARRIDALPAAERAAGVAMMVTVLGVAATAYGIWQSHWLSVIGAAAALFIVVQPARP
ncbi:MAG TPA: O-antigen ligase family protein, partial [Kiloniellaceae bacterium]|nr:O-antigen ligase family protein [Kiloniellaceae bacterium]